MASDSASRDAGGLPESEPTGDEIMGGRLLPLADGLWGNASRSSSRPDPDVWLQRFAPELYAARREEQRGKEREDKQLGHGQRGESNPQVPEPAGQGELLPGSSAISRPCQ